MTGDRRARPGPAEGAAACDAATDDPALGSVGAGTGAAVGKLRGREFAVKTGVGMAKQHLPQGAKLVALAVVNAFGDVIGEDGQVLAGTRGDDGGFIGSTKLIRTRPIEPPSFRRGEPLENTTLVCLMTDAELTKTECGIVAKMAHAGMARAVDPVHSQFDGDVVFTLASGTAPAGRAVRRRRRRRDPDRGGDPRRVPAGDVAARHPGAQRPALMGRRASDAA